MTVRMRCVSRDGTTVVECIRLSCTGTGRDGEWLRVKRHGFHVADVRTVGELARLGIDPADLTEADLLPPHRPLRAEVHAPFARCPASSTPIAVALIAMAR
jgi:hypothetical protein